MQHKVGIIVNYGSHFQRVGLQFGNCIFNNNVQLNNQAILFYCKKGIGPNGSFLELQLQSGLQIGFGKQWNREQVNMHFFDGMSCFIHKPYSIGYTYLYYIDNRKTTQSSGCISMAYKKIQMRFQNDGIAFLPWDEYRTGTFQFVYTDSMFQIGSHIALWTGQTRYAKSLPPNKNARFGTKDFSNGRYANTSAGLFYLSASVALPFLQNANLYFGIDDERIRNLFQNKIIHNNPLVHQLNSSVENKVIPMLDTENKLKFDSTQQIKRPSLFIQIGLNTPLVY